MKKRQPARPGLSYFDANRHRLITETVDVTNIKREIESRWPGVLSVFFDTEDERWVVVEHCRDGVDRFVLATKALSQRILDKLQREDEAAHVQPDLNRKFELEDIQVEREKEHNLSEATGEGGEKLFHALKKDGVIHAPQVFLGSSR